MASIVEFTIEAWNDYSWPRSETGDRVELWDAPKS
jgi:hypothetical protein